MKKHFFLLSLLLSLTLGIGQMWAETVEFTPSNCTSWNSTQGSQSQTLSGITLSSTSAANNTQLRLYSGGTHTFTSTVGNITSIVFTCTANGTSNYGPGKLSGTGYTASSGKTGEWTGSATSVTISGGQARCTSILVTYTPSGGTPKCDIPTFSPAAGSYEGTQNVTITSTEGATIYYTIDGSTPSTSSSVYSEPIAVSADMTIKAYAVKEGSNDSEVAEAAYTITEGPDVTLDFTDNTNWQFPTAKQVAEGTYSDGTYTVKVAGSTSNGFQFSSGKLLLGKSGAYIILPTFANPIERIECPGVSGASGKVTWNVYDGTTEVSLAVTGCTADATFEISPLEADKEYTIRITNDNNLQISKIKIYFGDAPAVNKPTISGDESFLASTTVTISQADADHIYYTTDGSTPTTSSAEYTAAFTLNATATVKAIAVKGSDVSTVAEKVFTKITPLTVAEAYDVIDAGLALANRYVQGTISQIDAYSSQYKSIQYWISDDGTTTNQLEAYSGKGLNGADFSAVTDLNVGDDVVIFGTLKKYNSTYEFVQNNYIVARKPIARLAWSGTTAGAFEASLEGGNTFPTLTNSDEVSVSYSSDNTEAATINASTGEISLVAVGSATITASFVGNESFKANSVSYTLNVSSSVIKANISFECNGATSCPEDELAASNLPSPLPSVTKAGKNFGGWFMDSEFNTPAQAGAAVESNDPITLYAKWLDPYTITQAKAVIDATPAGTANQYVAGIISQIDNYISNSHAITYWISVDGTTTDQLEVYKGLIGNAATPLGKDAFDAKENLELGDVVVVYGTLKKYNNTYEFDQNNTIYSFNRPEKPSISADPATVSNVAVGGVTNQTIALTYENIDNYETEVTIHPNADGTGTLSPAWLTASVSDADNYATITYSVSANDGAARTAYIKIYATDGNKEATKIISVSQVKYEAPAEPATLPFAFDGGKSNIESTQGMSQEGLDSDYSSSPKLKFNSTGDNVIINFASDPGKLTYDIKGNSFSGSTFTVQESADGSNYSNVATYTALSDVQSETKTLAQTTRYVKFIYTEKSSGNVALGNIAIAKYVESATLESIAISGTATELEYTAGQTFNPAGLIVTGHYSDNSDAEITEGIVWAFDPDPLTEETTSVSVTATVDEISSDAFVVNGLTVNAASSSTTGDTYTKVTSSDDITAGEYILVYGGESETLVWNGLDAVNGNVSATVSENSIAIPEGAVSLTLSAIDGGFSIMINGGDNNGKYIGQSSDANGIQIGETVYTNSISLNNDGIDIVSGGAHLRFNSTSSQMRFRYYKSASYTGQQPVQLYKKVAVTPDPVDPEPEEPIYTEVRSGLETNRFYTACLDRKVTAVRGASFWGISKRNAAGTMAYLEEMTAPIAAGTPFIYFTNADKFEVVYEGVAVKTPGENGALRGTLEYMDADALAAAGSGIYLMYQNALHPRGTNNHLDANRAYLVYGELESVNEEPVSAPGRRVRSMPMQGNVATGMEAIFQMSNGNENACKVMIDGQLFILRGEKLYDTTGRLVK